MACKDLTIKLQCLNDISANCETSQFFTVAKTVREMKLKEPGRIKWLKYVGVSGITTIFGTWVREKIRISCILLLVIYYVFRLWVVFSKKD